MSCDALFVLGCLIQVISTLVFGVVCYRFGRSQEANRAIRGVA